MADRGLRATSGDPAAPARRTPVRRLAAQAALVLAAAAVMRVGLLDIPPHYDEIYQTLAARSWVRDGTFGILDGAYDRAWSFSVLLGGWFGLLGDDGFPAARLLSVIFGSLSVMIFFLWSRYTFGRAAGWITAFLMACWPIGILMSQFARFYALHGLLFGLGCIAVHALAGPGLSARRRGALGTVAFACFALAAHLQLTTLIGLAGVALWFGLFVAGPLVWRRRDRWRLIAGGLALAALLLVALAATGALDRLWAFYRWAPWPAQADTFLYHRYLRDGYPTLWPLFPVAAVIAVAARPRPAAFCLCIFSVAFVAHSFGGMKAPRYLYYVMPFLFVTCATAIQEIAPMVLRFLRARSMAAVRAVGGRDSTPLATLVVAAAAGFMVFSNASIQRSFSMAAGEMVPPVGGRFDWSDGREAVRRLAGDGAVIVTSEELFAVLYLEGYDVGINRSRLSEVSPQEFAIDPRTGRPLISTVESFRRLVACRPAGVVVSTPGWWRHEGYAADFMAVVLRAGRAAAVDRGYRDMVIFSWRPGGAAAGDCAGVPDSLWPPQR